MIGIVVERIRQVPGERVVGNFDDKSRKVLDGGTGYYTRITLTNESGNDLSWVVVPRFELRAAGGGESDVALIGGEVESCPEEVSSPESFDRKGAKWVTCEAGAASALSLTEVHYLGVPYGEEIAGLDDSTPPPFNEEYYSLGAIVWS